MQRAGLGAGRVDVDMRPSIILCPAHVLNVWLAKYEQFFSARFKLFVLAGPSSPRSKYTIEPSDLGYNLLVPGAALYKDNPDAVGVTILASYEDWWL